MTENTTASGAADFPEFPAHPEPQTMRWSALEIVAIRKYGAAMYRAGRLAASAPVAPAPQPAPMPYPTDAQIDAVYEQTMSQPLRSQDAPAVRRFGRAMFLCAWNAAAPKADHIPEAGKKVGAPITEAEQAAWHAGLDEGRSQARVPLQQGEYPVWPEPAIFDGVDRSGNPVSHGYSATQVNELLDAARGAAQAAPAPVIALLDRIADLEAQLESIGAGGVHGPLIGCASPPTAQAEGWTKPHRTITYTCPVCAASLERQE